MSIASIILLGLGAVTAFFFFSRAAQTSLPQAAAESGSALGTIGTGLGSFGSGIAALGSGIGSGITGLFSPLTFFSNLIARISPPTSAPQPNPTQGNIPGTNLPEPEFTAGASTGCDDCFFPSREGPISNTFLSGATKTLTGATLAGSPITVNTTGLSPATVAALGGL